MLKATFDLYELDRSIAKAAKRFGETNKTAIARWGVATCRELARSTQPYGVGGTKKKQTDAIEAGMRAVLRPVDARTFKQSRGQTLDSPEAISAWVDAHRGGSKGHARLGGDRRAVCKRADFNKALRARKARAGMAKGAWIGAGQDIARRQRGPNQLRIGKSFLSWAQKHSGMGDSRSRLTAFRAVADLINKARHSNSQYVLKDSHKRKAVTWGGRKTLKWYQRAAKQALNKK